MSTTVIVLIVIGLIFIFVSFALSEKLSEEKEESAGVVKIPKELTQEQKEKIDTLIRDYMDQQVDGKLADIETRLAEIVNQKTLELPTKCAWKARRHDRPQSQGGCFPV